MKGILLLSDGIDSSVAGYLMVKKGVVVTGLNIKLGEGQDELEKIKELSRKIGINKIIRVDLTAAHQEFKKKCNPRLTCVFCKRMMYRVAERFDYDYIITGENLGQVASQTLDNMMVIDEAINKIVLRPLLCFDKNDIIKIARDIGTYDVSILKSHLCQFLPKSVATRSKLENIKREEEKLDIAFLIKNATESAVVMENY